MCRSFVPQRVYQRVAALARSSKFARADSHKHCAWCRYVCMSVVHSPLAQADISSGSDGSAESFWDWWNQKWRFGDKPDSFMHRQLEETLAVAQKYGLRDARIFDVGC